jgi:hypothetical protein
VTLTYGSTTDNKLGEMLTALGIVALAFPSAIFFVLRRKRRVSVETP